MCSRYDGARSISGPRNPIWFATAALLLSLLLFSPVYGCKVKNVYLHIGQTETEAKNETYKDKTVCCTFYWYLRWTADTPNTNEFTVVWEIYDGSDWVEWDRREDVPGNARSWTLDVTGSELSTAGDHTMRGKVKRNDVGDTLHPSNTSTATIVEVSSVDTDPSGTDVVCINESVTFKATTSSGGNYDMVDWSGGGTPSTKEGSETFITKWATTGTETVKACCEDSCAEYEIEVIEGLTVLPHESYVCIYGTKEFEAWVCEGGVAVQKTSTDGVEWSASNGSFTGDTYEPFGVSASVGDDSVTAEFDGDEDSAVVTNFKCDVTSADVCEDNIHVDLEPSGLSGTLKLELDSHTIREVSRSSGSYDETFDIPNLPIGEYQNVKATWTVEESPCLDEYGYHIKVLGEYRHSTYNIPRESCYSGSSEDVCYTSGNCTVTDCTWSTGVSALASFLDATELNGSGYSNALGYVTTEEWCPSHGYPPPSECTGDLLRDLTITGGCPKCTGMSLVAGETVAIKPSHPDLSCGDEVCVHTIGTRTVTDHGGGLSSTQLDHYMGLSDCSTATDLGNYITIKLY